MKNFPWLWCRFGALVLFSFVSVSGLAGKQDGRLDIYWIDVVGGAATLMVTPAGESVLVDTGMPRERDVGRIEACLRDIAGLDHLDHLIISHYDLDHYGGAAQLAERIPVVNLFDNGRFPGMRNDPGEAYFGLPAEQKYVLDPGDTVPLQQATGTARIKLKCLATRMDFISAPKEARSNPVDCSMVRGVPTDQSENANSMVLLLSFGKFEFFNATDLTWNLEAKLVCPDNLVGQVDVYQTTHHGLDRSNNPVVLEALQPCVAVMNNGPTKGCQPEMVAALRATPSIEAIYQMHRNQRPDGHLNNTEPELIANTEAGKSGNIIKLSVDPSGRSYHVEIPATGHRRRFQVR